MHLNLRLFSLYALVGAFTVAGFPTKSMVFATPPVCQVYVTSLRGNHITIIDGVTSQVSSLAVGDLTWNVAVTPDGSKAYLATDNTGIKVIDVDGGYSLSTISEASFILATSPDGNKLYTAGWSSGVLKEFNTSTGVATGRSGSTGTNPGAIAVSPDGAHIYVANYNSSPATITKIATSTFTATDHQVDPGGVSPAGVAVSPDGTKLYSVLYFGGKVQEIRTSDMTVLRTVVVPNNSRDVVTNSTGSKIYVTSSNTNYVIEIDTLTFAVTDTIVVGVQPQKLAISPDDRFLFVTNETGNSVSKINLSTNSVVDTITVNDRPFGIAIGPSNCTTIAPPAPVTPAVVVTPETTAVPTTTLAPTTTSAPATTVLSPPAELPETGTESNGWLVVAMFSVIAGTVLAARRRQSS